MGCPGGDLGVLGGADMECLGQVEVPDGVAQRSVGYPRRVVVQCRVFKGHLGCLGGDLGCLRQCGVPWGNTGFLGGGYGVPREVLRVLRGGIWSAWCRVGCLRGDAGWGGSLGGGHRVLKAHMGCLGRGDMGCLGGMWDARGSVGCPGGIQGSWRGGYGGA